MPLAVAEGALSIVVAVGATLAMLGGLCLVFARLKQKTKQILLARVERATGARLDPAALTIGFARRATPYKRADLVLRDLDRLRAIAKASGPLQLVFAGKARARGRRPARQMTSEGGSNMRTGRWIALVVVVLGISRVQPSRAEEAGWEAVGEVLGAAGKVLPDGTYRIDVPRTSPQLRNEFGFPVPPSMVLTYAAFAGAPADATVVGDTCMLGEEVNPVVDALRAGNLEVVAIHNHMLGGTPNFIFLHFQGRGDARELARAIRKAWDEMGKEHPLPERKPGAAPKPDWEEVSKALGLKGVLQEDGTYKFALPRPHLGTGLDGRTLPAGVGLACWVGFAPCECGLTMIMGDTCLRRHELQQAIDGYRKNGIRIVAIHNHMLGTTPELIFCHFAAEGEAVDLARAVRTVWDKLAPAKPQ